MWNNYDNQYSSYNGGPPDFPNHFSSDGGSGIPTPAPEFPAPAHWIPTPQHDYNSGYHAPPGPPPHHGSQLPYGFMPEPQFFSHNPPPGPPPSTYGTPPGPPTTRGFSAQQYHQQHQRGHPDEQARSSDGYPGQQQSGQSNTYRPPLGPPPRPPTQVQNYGPRFQTADHDVQPFFQYSQCTGKKKALCIGINYFGREYELRGCINDVKNIQDFIISQYNYRKEDIVILTDDATDSRAKPTRSNILQAMQELVRDAQPNDSLFFHYSGHGAQVRDTDGDDIDGYDEVIYPVDWEEYESEGYIVDDLIHETMVKLLPAGCRLTAIFDSCHSGTAMDLPYVYSSKGKVKEPNLAAEAVQGFLSAFASHPRGDMRPAMGPVRMSANDIRRAKRIMKATKTSPADVVSWSGCKDSQAALDANEAGQATGAMSYAFITALRANKQQSYRQLLVAIRDILKSKGQNQKPQLSSSHPMNTNIMFIC